MLNENVMSTLIYVRASTKEQDASRVLDDLILFSKQYSTKYTVYSENITGTKLERPELNRLLDDANQGDVLLVESVDRLSRLKQDDFDILKQRIKSKGIRLVVMDLPTTHQTLSSDTITSSVLDLVNNLLIDLLATMARLDNDKRKERIKQGLVRAGYVPKGKKADTAKHKRIIELSNTNKMNNDEIAKAVGVGVATVYRVLKANKD